MHITTGIASSHVDLNDSKSRPAKGANIELFVKIYIIKSDAKGITLSATTRVFLVAMNRDKSLS